MTPWLPLLAVAAAPSNAQIDRFLERSLKATPAPGMSVAIVRNGKLAYAKGFGYADLENGVRATPSTVYRIGSVTKQFTATAIMQLIGEGKLGLDDPMRKHLPDLPEAWDGVTVRQLMNHTSGIPSYTGFPEIMGDKVRDPITPRGIVATMEGKALEFAPGTKWNYNNTAYEILGLLIEKYDGRPLEQSYAARIFRPVGMTQTYFTGNGEVVKHRAHGYTLRNGKIGNADYLDMGWPYAAGSMESTVLDLAKWDMALNGERILPQTSLRQMYAKTRLADGKNADYGFGWQLDEVNGVPIIHHGGGIHGFISQLRRAPSRGLSVVVLTNSDRSDAGEIAERLMGFLDPQLKPQPPKAIPDNDPATTRFVRQTLDAIRAGTLDRKTLSEEMAKGFTPEFLAEIRKQTIAMGPMKEFFLIAAEDKDGRKHRTYSVMQGETRLTLRITLGPTGLIENMTMGR